MKENKIGGIPVVDADRKLIGIVTNRDLRFQRDMSRRIEAVSYTHLDVYKRQDTQWMTPFTRRPSLDEPPPDIGS